MPLTLGLAGFSHLEALLLRQWLALAQPGLSCVTLPHTGPAPVLNGVVANGHQGAAPLDAVVPSLASLPTLCLGPGQAPAALAAHWTWANAGEGSAAVSAQIHRWLAGLPTAQPPSPPAPSPTVSAPTGRLAGRSPLSPREKAVLDLLAHGHSNEAIAQALAIRLPTVKTYLRRVYDRTGALNRAHAVALYLASQSPAA